MSNKSTTPKSKKNKVKPVDDRSQTDINLTVSDAGAGGGENGASGNDDDMKESVMVVVRVRPLNQREKDMNSSTCVQYGGTKEITIEKDDEKKSNNIDSKKKFTFDFVFGEKSKQDQVYAETGRKILSKCVNGFNGCIFAYGQTGSGKTHTMEGNAEDPGVMMRLGKDLFTHYHSMDKKLDYEIKASYLEIYQERVIDLLAKRQGLSSSAELRILEDKIRGIYVLGLTETTVSSYEDIQSIIAGCTNFRTKGETKMNAVSSRSHAVLTLYIESKDKSDNEGFTQKFHKINLIDLAGSERAKDTGAAGQTLKEGAKINASLSALGGVINSLVQGKGHVPYRDSKLTRLLQDSLGGNSVTLLVAAMSPATVNFEDSLSTLQFADRAKKIKNKVKVNIDPKLARIRELLAENEKLRERITALERDLAKYRGEGGADSSCCCLPGSGGNQSNAASNTDPACADEEGNMRAAQKKGCCTVM